MTRARRFERAEELYHAALEHRPGERDGFLARACGEDRELLREVRSLLGYAAEAKQLLEEPAGAAETQELRPDPARWVGRRLGRYEVLSPLGAGGMGEVYRAKDTTLGREVALKLLPEAFARDPERVSRFRDEARLLASLNHPNIAAIHGLEEADGELLLALELVEGETLKERLDHGAIPLGEALEIARQIAEGLEAAHEKGIVHRDLKPANVKLTPEGKAKVLDFGLAKAWAGDTRQGSSPSAALSQPTPDHTGTEAGLILGTAAYMSPEQARGRPVDKRADIWSFGALLWEILTGQAPFAGDTVSDVIAAVVTEEPDLAALPAATPRAVRRLLSRCLRKDPRKRLPDIGAARLELEEALAGAEGEAPSAASGGSLPSATGRHARERWAWAIAVASAGLAALLAFALLTRVPEPAAAVHLVLDTPADLSFERFDNTAVSPDGRRVAFAGVSSGGSRRLWIRPLESPEARPFSGTEGATGPFWSPDGGSVAFAAAGELRKLTLASGTVQTICALPRIVPAWGSWNREGIIVFESGGTSARLYSVMAAGGEAKPLTVHDASRGETAHHAASFLPDGRHFLFTVASAQEESTGVYVSSLDAPEERRRLLTGITRVVYSSGHLLFARGGTLFAQPFDTGGLQLSGEPVPIAQDVSHHFPSGGGWGFFSASPGPVLAYRGGRGAAAVQLEWRDRSGTPLGTVGEPGNYGQIALSPDERRAAVEVRSEESADLWVIDIGRGVASRLTDDPGNELDPVWSPDSQEVAYGSNRVGEHLLFRKGLRGEPAVPVPGARGTDNASRDRPEDWSPDGRVLLCKKLNGTTLWALPLQGGGDPEPVLELDHRLDEPAISPDGRWLAYTSEQSGRWEVYVQPYRRSGERVRMSVDGGGQPEWRGDGRELFFVGTDGQLMGVDVREGTAGLEVSRPTALFEVGESEPYLDTYAVSADGQRFLVKAPVGGPTPERIHVVTNWTSLLK